MQYFADYTAKHGHGPVATANTHFNDIANTVCATPMVVAMVLAIFMDNVIKASGARRWRGALCVRWAGRCVGHGHAVVACMHMVIWWQWGSR